MKLSAAKRKTERLSWTWSWTASGKAHFRRAIRSKWYAPDPHRASKGLRLEGNPESMCTLAI
jgi:hypothetical protein